MATQKTGATNKSRAIKIEDLLSKEREMGPTTYANHVQFTVTPQEILVDFHLIHPGINGQDFRAQHMQRLVLPYGMGRAMVTALSNLLDQTETDRAAGLLDPQPPEEASKP